MKTSIPKRVLIVGLGNPGEKYESTPHNAGFLVINKLLAEYGLNAIFRDKLAAEVAETEIADKKIILAKPTTFMNGSGAAIKALTKSYKLKAASSVWLIHDDIDLLLGKLKIVKNRGSAGHKGVEDVIQKLKTKDFVRFRIGTLTKHLPPSRPKSLMNKFVVSGFDKKEKEAFEKSIELAKTAVIFALENSIEKAANIHNK